MAGIFEDLVAGLVGDGERKRPRAFEGFGIIDGGLVVDDVLGHRSKPLNDVQRIAGGRAAVSIRSNAVAFLEIHRVHYKGVAFPMSYRIAHISPNAGTGVRASIGWDDTRFVNHFIANHHIARSLSDIHPVA